MGDFKTFYESNEYEDLENDFQEELENEILLSEDYLEIFEDIELEDELDLDEEINEKTKSKPRTKLDRKKTRGKKLALAKAFKKGDYATASIFDKANFIAKYEYVETSVGKGRYKKRKNPKNVADVVKQLKKKGKQMRKMMKSKGKSIQKKAQRIKARNEK